MGWCRAFLVAGLLAALSEADAGAAEIRVIGAHLNASTPDLPSALAVVIDHRADNPTDNVVIEIPEGLYPLSEPLQISSSATGAGSLTLRGPATGTARLVGSVKVVTSAPPPGRLAIIPFRDPSVRERVRFVDLIANGLPDPAVIPRRGTYIDPSLEGFDLYANSQRMTLARWPNDRYTNDLVARPALSSQVGPTVIPAAVDFARWSSEAALWFGGYWHRDWAWETAPVDEVKKNGVLQFGRIATPLPIRERFRSFVFNAETEIDRPLEYAIAADGHSAVFLPPENESLDISATLSRSILDISGARHLRIEDLDLSETRGDVVSIQGSSNVVISNSHIHGSGGRGIVVRNSSDVKISRTVVSDTAATGIVLDGGDRILLKPGNLVVSECIITNFGVLARARGRGVEISGVGNRIERSAIFNGPHHAITFSGNDHTIRENEFFDVALETDDTSAIYVGRDWTARGTAITDNYLHDIGFRNEISSLVSGIYLDDGASGIIIERNIFDRVSRGVLIHGGRDNRISENVFLDLLNPPLWIGPAFTFTSRDAWDTGGIMRKRFEAMPINSPIWRSRYPELVDLPNRNFSEMEGNVFTDNVMLGFADVADGNRIFTNLIVQSKNKRIVERPVGVIPISWRDRLGSVRFAPAVAHFQEQFPLKGRAAP